MKCPICKTDVGDSNICEQCGFSDIRSEFLSQEDADFWMQNIVIPYKDNYNKSDVLPPIDWLDIFKQNPQAKQLFDFSIPAAIKRRETIDSVKDSMDYEEYLEYSKDAVLGHFAIVSKNEIIRKHFFETIKEEYLCTTTFSRTSAAALERASDWAAVLSNVSPYTALVFDANTKIKKDIEKILPNALKEYCLDIVIGKGPGARNVRIDLPAFTAIFIAESMEVIPTSVANVCDNIIEINFTQEELDELQIREIAPLYDIQLTRSNLEVIKEYCSSKTFRNVKGILKYISDYLYLHSEVQQPISAENLKKIIDTL